MAYLQIEKFNKTFSDGFKVLKDISFSLDKGQVLSIIGSSGSGKTTLLRCLNFLEMADEGKIILNNDTLFDAQIDKNTSDKVLREKRLNFGLVFQSFNLFPQYKVIDNVILAPNMLLKEEVNEFKKQLKGQNLSYKEKKLKVKNYIKERKEQITKDGLEILDKVGLIEKTNSYPCELSGGQQQRVAIARAMALKPNVLCFDEPTSALDPELTGEVLKVIKELKKNTNMTMVIVTHEMEFAKNISDRILFMSDGRCEEFGTPEEIFENPKNETLQHFLKSYNEGKL